LVGDNNLFKAPAPLEGPSLYDPKRADLFPLHWGDLAHSRVTAAVTASNRRGQHRFPLVLKLTYTWGSGQHGSGELINMGSSGLLFRCSHRFVKGELIRVSVEWPYLLGGSCPLQLCVHGRILRSGDSGTALTTMKYEFRTARRIVPAAALPPTPGTESPLTV
jgi:hypothetical protein